MQEAAYAMLTDARRRELHGRVGAALEALAGDDPSPRTFAQLARHYTAADDPAKAAEYLIRAGDEARGLSADREAIHHYRRAREFLSRLGDDRRSRETLFKIALEHHLAFDFEGAERAYDEAFACKVEALLQPELCERLTAAVIRPGPRPPAPGGIARRFAALFSMATSPHSPVAMRFLTLSRFGAPVASPARRRTAGPGRSRRARSPWWTPSPSPAPPGASARTLGLDADHEAGDIRLK